MNEITNSGENWISQFVQYQEGERAYANNSIDAYAIDLEEFRSSLHKDVLQASSDDIRKFILGCLDRGVSPKTARRKLCAIRSFYQFVYSEDGLAKDPSRDIRGPKAHRTLVRPITREEVELILASIGNEHPIDIRNRAILHVCYGSGLRASELTNMRIADLNFAHSVAKVRLGKGQKDRHVPLNELEVEAIRQYLELARPHFVKTPDEGILFIGRYGEILTRQRLWQIVTELSMKVIGRVISPHKYRHAFVTDTTNGGASLRVVQKMAGHRSVRTTQGYLHSDLGRVRAEYLKSHPRGIAS
jgi:site-specific recombinase XerD